jgi:hypothetical protein
MSHKQIIQSIHGQSFFSQDLGTETHHKSALQVVIVLTGNNHAASPHDIGCCIPNGFLSPCIAWKLGFGFWLEFFS